MVHNEVLKCPFAVRALFNVGDRVDFSFDKSDVYPRCTLGLLNEFQGRGRAKGLCLSVPFWLLRFLTYEVTAVQGSGDLRRCGLSGISWRLP